MREQCSPRPPDWDIWQINRGVGAPCYLPEDQGLKFAKILQPGSLRATPDLPSCDGTTEFHGTAGRVSGPPPTRQRLAGTTTSRPFLIARRNNLLDIYRVDDNRLGIFREPFERVMEFKGFEISQVEGATEVWNFRNSASGQKGRLLNVNGFLNEALNSISTQGRAYMITRQEFTLALFFPGKPRRIKLNQSRYKTVPIEEKKPIPPHWPREMVTRVIRLRFSNIFILDESFLLQQIGLRGSL